MVELLEENFKDFERQSSKGNQLKWEREGVWYKADYCGYEGLTEYVISRLLEYSTLKNDEYVKYSLQKIGYKNSIYNGASSKSFHIEGWQEITIERLYKNFSGKSLYQTTWAIEGEEERLRFFVDQIERITGLKEFGRYVNKLFTIDALFLNEDRHMHNIAVLMNKDGKFDYCPIFDNGAGLLSDVTMDYPLGGDIYKYIDSAEAKTICSDFEAQLEASEKLYGYNLQFDFTKKDVEDIINKADIYSEEIRDRVYTIIVDRMRVYNYLFTNIWRG